MDQRADLKQLRSFGFLVGGVFAVIGAWPLLFQAEPMRLWPLVSGTTLIFSAALFPSLLAPVHKAWMWFGHVLGWMNTRILLGLVFYGLITPIGILFRLLGKGTMNQAFVDGKSTYRVPRQRRPHTHMKYQF